MKRATVAEGFEMERALGVHIQAHSSKPYRCSSKDVGCKYFT
jgi:hypothetical protein